MLKTYLSIVILLFLTPACSAKEQQDTSQQYWTEFRQAVIANDYKKLQSHSQLPLELHGAVDSIPVQKIGDEQFGTVIIKVLEQPLASYEGDKLVTYTQRELVIKTTTLDSKQIKTDKRFRIGELVFELQGNTWKLVRVYLSE